METQAQYWIWMKRHRDQILNYSFSDSSSWEEKAFAEGAAAARSLGGCIWPPRSYSCSFCRREFKSAQALGGHMNVHRRDRARLKNSLKLSTNPNCPSDQSSASNNAVVVVVESSPFSYSRVSVTSSTTQENSSTSFVHAKHNVKDYVETNLSVGLKPNICYDEAISCKGTKTSAAVSTLPFFTPNEKENLDLELRLGDPPKGIQLVNNKYRHISKREMEFDSRFIRGERTDSESLQTKYYKKELGSNGPVESRALELLS